MDWDPESMDSVLESRSAGVGLVKPGAHFTLFTHRESVSLCTGLPGHRGEVMGVM